MGQQASRASPLGGANPYRSTENRSGQGQNEEYALVSTVESGVAADADAPLAADALATAIAESPTAGPFLRLDSVGLSTSSGEEDEVVANGRMSTLEDLGQRLDAVGTSDQTRLLEDSDSDDGSSGPVTRIKTPHSESFLSVTLQIFFPFLVAGLGMVGAGLVLDVVQHWGVFVEVSELFILVPALLGLKGNLEMTLASRLSTHANLGRLDQVEDCWRMITANLALIQCQAVVVGLLASLFAVIVDWLQSPTDEEAFDPGHALLLCASSLVTASLASFVLGLVMVAVILASRRCRVNPDNVATPIAASLGNKKRVKRYSKEFPHMCGSFHISSGSCVCVASCRLANVEI